MSRFDDVRASWRQLVVGVVAIPLSLAPFALYGTLTTEGRLLRDRVRVALAPPDVAGLTRAEVRAIREVMPRYRNAVAPLVYHGIGEATDGGRAISPERFSEHLAALRAAGMHAVTASEVAEAFSGGDPLPPNAVMISFDDGRTDAMLWADELLDDAGMRATMFVITGAASRSSTYYASWDDLEKYAKSGRWDLQSHTSEAHHEQTAAGGRSLPALTSRAPGESLASYRTRVRRDLAAASAALARHTGRPPVAFAYPFGAYGADRTNDDRIERVLGAEVSRRYQLAFHQDGQDTIPLATASDDRLGLRRLDVGDWSGRELVKHIAAAADRTPGLDVDHTTPVDWPDHLALAPDPAPVAPAAAAPAPVAVRTLAAAPPVMRTAAPVTGWGWGSSPERASGPPPSSSASSSSTSSSTTSSTTSSSTTTSTSTSTTTSTTTPPTDTTRPGCRPSPRSGDPRGRCT